jgi:hypothetical protein
MALTVGYVSGIIAAAVHVLQVFLPTALALMIAGAIREESTAATWSVAGSALHSSHWARLLRSDTSNYHGIDKRIKTLILLRPLALAVIAVAAVITPLGLYDDILPGRSPQQVPFPYISDLSPMGYGTPPRSDLGFNRQCGFTLPVVCPGSDTVISYSGNDTSVTATLPYGYDSRIPQTKTELFESGLTEQSETVSSIFDIQWRSYTTRQDINTNNGSTFLAGGYRQLTTLILDDTIEAVEGLLVNTISGGLGFRNHTIPSGIPLGATWTEDLLFVEPETQCVDTNLTLDFSLAGLNSSLGGEITNLVITDRGGFINLNHTYPHYDRTKPELNADLAGRAYKAAWLFNVYIALIFNVTRPNPGAFGYLNSNMGKTFPLQGGIFPSVDALSSSTFDGGYNDLFAGLFSNSSLGPSNPFHITETNFSSITTICQSEGGLDFANISNIAVGCGVLYGAPRREDGTASLIFEPGSRWTLPMYSCATSVKASVKEVSFRYNGTDGLKSLATLSIQDQMNPPNPVTWGVENTQMTLADGSALWGLVSASTQESPELSVVQSPYLYLPGDVSSATLPTVGGYQNLPGVDFYTDALSTVFQLDSGPLGVADYTGKTNLAMYAKWQNFSRTADGTANVVNLIWTDIAANSVVGTKSWLPSPPPTGLQKRESQITQVAVVSVTVYSRRIQYKWLFAIPAALALAISGLIGLTTFALVVVGHARPSKVKTYLNALSPGRILATFVYPNECDSQAPTDTWVKSVGSKKIAISKHGFPTARDPVAHPTGPVATGYHGYEYSMTDPLLTKNGTAIMMRSIPPAAKVPGTYGNNGPR